MKNLFFLIVLFSFLSGCQSTKDALTLKKKNNSDEFLVEKKNPLVMPPNYNQLPTPEDFQSKTLKPENNAKDEFENILKKSENKSAENTTKKSDIGQSVIEKIN